MVHDSVQIASHMVNSATAPRQVLILLLQVFLRSDWKSTYDIRAIHFFARPETTCGRFGAVSQGLRNSEPHSRYR